MTNFYFSSQKEGALKEAEFSFPDADLDDDDDDDDDDDANNAEEDDADEEDNA